MRNYPLCLLLFACQPVAPKNAPPNNSPTTRRSSPASVAALQDVAPASLQSASAPTTSRPAPTAGCLVLHEAWRAELFGEELSAEDEAELARYIERFPCSLQLDLDGDARPERVSIVNKKDKVGLGIVWGDGRTSTLGAGTKLKLGPGAEVISDFNWLSLWEPVTNTNHSFTINVLKSPHAFEASEALGDGLLLDGGDASAVLYLSKKGWRLLELGF